MGGIDLLNMCTNLYKYQLRYCRWYMYIFYHSLTVAVVNSWFLYRQYHEEQGTDKDVLPFRKFQAICTQSLTLAGNGKRRSCGLPSLEEILSAHRLQKKEVCWGTWRCTERWAQPFSNVWPCVPMMRALPKKECCIHTHQMHEVKCTPLFE